MSNEDELSRVEDAIDDLQASMQQNSLVIFGSTFVLIGVISARGVNNLISYVLSFAPLIFGIITIINALNSYRAINDSQRRRKINRYNLHSIDS
jgi:hypothetical protein